LAGRAAGDDVDGFNGGPVDAGDVAVVGDVRPVVGEDAGGCLSVAPLRVVLGEPSGFGAEYLVKGALDAAVAGEQGPD
jgi:hypothetical protein